MDYAGNSNKDKEQGKKKKEIERVTTGEVLIPKKGLWEKFKETFIADNFKNVSTYAFHEILIPALQNMVADTTSGMVDRMFGVRGRRGIGIGSGTGPRITYNSPVRRYGYTQDNLDRRNLPSRSDLSRRSTSTLTTDIVLATKEEAMLVLERMTDICDQYQIVTVGDLNSLVGLPSTHVDEKWGWEDLRSAQIRDVREGYLLDLPQPQPIQ